MTPDGQRIASLERQVAGLSARVGQLARQAFVIKTLEGIAVERAGYGSTGAASSALQAAFDAGRACVSQDTAPRPPVQRLRHLHAVEARHA
jgi:hypothetical protein